MMERSLSMSISNSPRIMESRFLSSKYSFILLSFRIILPTTSSISYLPNQIFPAHRGGHSTSHGRSCRCQRRTFQKRFYTPCQGRMMTMTNTTTLIIIMYFTSSIKILILVRLGVKRKSMRDFMRHFMGMRHFMRHFMRHLVKDQLSFIFNRSSAENP